MRLPAVKAFSLTAQAVLAEIRKFGAKFVSEIFFAQKGRRQSCLLRLQQHQLMLMQH